MDSKRLSNHWNTKVSKGHRHFKNVQNAHKDKLFTQRFTTHLLNQVDIVNEVGYAWDWGCGGGMLSKMLAEKNVNITMFDVSESSLIEAKRYVETYHQAVHVTDHPDKLSWDEFQAPDLIACYHVVWHFPGLAYFKALTKHWLNAAPRYIGISAKIGELSEYTTDNYTSDTFYRALIIPKATLIEAFEDDYDLMYYATELTDAKDSTIGNFVFKHK